MKRLPEALGRLLGWFLRRLPATGENARNRDEGIH